MQFMFVSTIFAAATGIVGASVTILGIMAGKTMIKSGYDTRLSAGLICAGGNSWNFNSTKHHVGGNGACFRNPSNRFICCSNNSWNNVGIFFMLFTPLLDVILIQNLVPILPKSMQPKKYG